MRERTRRRADCKAERVIRILNTRARVLAAAGRGERGEVRWRNRPKCMHLLIDATLGHFRELLKCKLCRSGERDIIRPLAV